MHSSHELPAKKIIPEVPSKSDLRKIIETISCRGITLSLALLLFFANGLSPESAPTVRAASNTGDIVGGRPAAIGEVPSQARLLSYFNEALHACGGVLIDREWLLTAAHCVSSNEQVAQPGDIEITLGEIYRNIPETTEQIPATRLVIIHPEYDPVTHNADLALVQISPITTTDAVAPIEMATTTDEEAPNGVIISGFGTTKEGGNLSPTLQIVDAVPLIPPEICNISYKDQPNQQVTDTMICAGKPEGGVDSCSGDSGGPVIIPEHIITDTQGTIPQTVTITDKLVGVISWGAGCARPGLPGVNTRVSRFTDWIADTIADSSKLYLPVVKKP